MIKIIRDHSYFALFYGALFLIFLWPLILLQKTFVYGDYWVQHLPWAFHYAQSLKAGHLPYWTHLMACGFPLVAEGQVGAYYFFNLASYSILPFKLAYTWSVPAHILFGGVGFYLYGKKIGLSKEAATLSAVVFSFSSGYGGCFINTASLRVLSWLPWSLLVLEILESASGRRRFLWISLLGVFISQMWTAGAMQSALYAMMYLMVIVLLKKNIKLSLFFITTGLLGFLLALPQLMATWELIKVSVRAGESASFALWRSVSPPALISLVYPEWGILLRVSFYIGILPFMLALVGVFLKRNKIEAAHGWLVVIFILLALGKYNLFYAFFVKNFFATALRNPSKFLFFAIASLSVLAGFGFDKLVHGIIDPGVARRLKRFILIFLFLVIFLPLAGSWILHFDHDFLVNQTRRYAEKVFLQKIDPIHDLAYYYRAADQALTTARRITSLKNLWNWDTVFLSFVSGLIFLKAVNHSFWKTRFKVFLPLIVILDLTLFGYFFGPGFIGNAKEIPQRVSELMITPLKNGDSSMAEWARDQQDELLPPNASMFYSIAHAGGYSPLLIKRYYELTKDLGFVDSSLGRHPYSVAVWSRQRKILDILGVNTVIADETLSFPHFKLSEVTNRNTLGGKKSIEDRRYIYKNFSALPQVYAVYDWKVKGKENERLEYIKNGLFEPLHEAVVENESFVFKPNPALQAASVEAISSTDGEVVAEITVLSDAVVVTRTAYYPRWKVEVDGLTREMVPVNQAFSGVYVAKGIHRVKFFYDETWNRRWEVAAMVLLSLLVLINISFWRSGGYEKK